MPFATRTTWASCIAPVASVAMTITSRPPTGAAESGAGEDDDLVALALASDPDVELDDDAENFWDVTDSGSGPWLPEWYMPTPMLGGPLLRGWRRRVVFLVIASFLVITAYGLCNTYGQLAFG
jgi:hypothetical protein